MSETHKATERGRSYYVYGSGLMAVPYHRLNDIPRLKSEFHAAEVSWAIMAAQTRKVA